jgi:hypothetical protein
VGSTPLEFQANVDAWVNEVPKRILEAFHESTQKTVSAIRQNLRTVVHVQTGFLRASETASTESMPPIIPGSHSVKGETYAFEGGTTALVINSATLEQTIYIGWVASYGPYLEYGTTHIQPRGFVRLAAEQWPAFVNETVQELKNRSA